MSFASLHVFTYAYPVSFLSKCHAKNRKEVLAVRTSYRKEVLALLSCSRKEVLAVSKTQAQATRNQPQEELLADAKRSSCACIIFGLYCVSTIRRIVTENRRYFQFSPNKDSGMISPLPNYRPFFSPFHHIPPQEPFVKVVISMHKIIMAVTVEKMLICSNLGVRSFRDGNQGICKYKESNMGQVSGF